jgi:hypothetical protein
MHTLHGFSTDELPRDLDVEVRGDQVYLYMHPPGNDEAGQKILVLVPKAQLLHAVRSYSVRIEGKAPKRGNAKACVVTAIPAQIEIAIHTPSAEWWMIVKRQDLEAALA